MAPIDEQVVVRWWTLRSDHRAGRERLGHVQRLDFARQRGDVQLVYHSLGVWPRRGRRRPRPPHQRRGGPRRRSR
eukprot:8616312-Pyramimonas_sp.AAC.1